MNLRVFAFAMNFYVMTSVACVLGACAGSGAASDDGPSQGGAAAGQGGQASPKGGSGGGGAGGAQGGQAGGGNSGTGGVGGSAGGTGGTGQGGGSASGNGCAGNELLCADFENVAGGALPTGGGWVARDGSCSSGAFTMGVTTDKAHGGTKALKVTNHSWAQCRLAAKFDTVDEFWVRAYVFWEPGVDFTDKEILAIDLVPPSGLGKDDPAVRFGSRTKEPCKASGGPQITIIGMGGGEQTGCSPNEPAKGQWHCFEAHIRQSSKLIAATYINGQALSYSSSGKQPSMTIETSSAITEKVNHIRLGFFTHNSTGMGNVYLDDVAVARTRVGCGN